MVDVDTQTELTADPVVDFTQPETLEIPIVEQTFSSRRERREAERAHAESTRAVKRERIVVKPAEIVPGSAEALRAEALQEQAARAEAARAESAQTQAVARTRTTRAVATARRAPAATPSPRRASRKLRAHTNRRRGLHAVVMLTLAAFFGTAALPAYATTAEGSTAGAARTALAVQTLTGGGATAQLVSRDGLAIAESPQALDATTNRAVSPTVQALAVQLMGAVAAGRLIGSTPNHIPEIANLAEGKVVPNCGVDYRVLQAIAVALDHFNQVGVSDINRLCTGQIEGAGTDSAHYKDGGGHAVDFYLLNGSPLTGGDPMALQLIRILDPIVPSGSNLGQAECRSSISLTNFKPFDDTCNHLHMDFIDATAPTLRYG